MHHRWGYRGIKQKGTAAVLLLLHGHSPNQENWNYCFLDRIHAAVVSERPGLKEVSRVKT